MALKLTSGRQKSAPRILIYGPPKVGKSTAAADTEEPVFVSGEAGDGQLNVSRVVFDERTGRTIPITWDEVLAVTREVAQHGGCKTLVYDGFGAIEKLAVEFVCKTQKWANIATPGYGKGEAALLAEMAKFLRIVEDAWTRGIGIVFVAHSKIGKAKNPAGDEYQRFSPALTDTNNGDVAGLIVGWVDAVLFAQAEVEVAKSERRVLGVSTGRHIFRTQGDAAWVAGCRYASVPPVMDLDMKLFRKLVAEGQDPDTMRRKVEDLLPKVDDATRAKVSAWLKTDAAKDVQALARAASNLQSKVEEVSAAA